MWQKIFGWNTTKYEKPKDSSLRSRPVKPEPRTGVQPKWKAPSYKNYQWGKGVGK